MTIYRGQGGLGDSYNDPELVHTSGDETIEGVKTFTSVIIGTISGHYSKAEEDTKLALKANQSTTYTKTEVDTLVTTKADQSTTYTKTEVDTALTGKLSTANGSVGTNNLADNAVTAAKIADSSVTTAKINNNAVTAAKLAREGTAGQVLTSNGTGADPSYQVARSLTSGTAVTASGTSIDFTSIPSWVKRITVMLNGVSSSGTSALRVQIGDSGGVATTGYTGSKTVTGASSAAASVYLGGGFDFDNNASANTSFNYATLVLTNISGNTWMASGNMGLSVVLFSATSGSKTLTNTLDRVRVTFLNGTDTFDAGSINILYE